MMNYVDILTDADEKEIDLKMAIFFFRTAQSFRTIEAQSFRDMVIKLRPSMTDRVKSASTLRGPMLDKVYGIVKKETVDKIAESKSFIVISDGWTNVNKQHIINFIVQIPSKKPFFYKSVNTSHMTLNAETMKELIVDVAKEIGIEKWVGLLTDNANVMQATADLIEKEYPLVFCNDCLSHGQNLFIKNVCELPTVQLLIKKCKILLKFVNNHRKLYHFYTEEIRPQLSISTGFVVPCDTRFYSNHTFFNSVLINKHGVRTLVEEYEDFILSECGIQRQTYYDFKAVVQDSGFWEDLKFSTEKLLLPAKEKISKFEADQSGIEYAYGDFLELFKTYESLPINHVIEANEASSLLKNCWDYLHTESLGYAHILAPRNLGTNMMDDDFEDTEKQVTGI